MLLETQRLGLSFVAPDAEVAYQTWRRRTVAPFVPSAARMAATPTLPAPQTMVEIMLGL